MTEAEQPQGGFGRAFTSLSLASGVSMGANLVRGKLAALFLGPAGVGIFNQLALMWNLFQIGGGLGSFNGVVRHGADSLAADDSAGLRRLASTSTLLLGTVSCLLVVVGVLFSAALSDLLLHDGGAHRRLVSLLLLALPLGVTAQNYRALLSAGRAVRQLVMMQIVSDVGAAIVFAVLISPFGLTGAILGFATIHLLLLITAAWNVGRVLGSGLVIPSISDFSWCVVRANIGFGASGLVMVALSNLSVLVVSRILISHQGLEANGIFSNAWRIASVYLGAITTTTISYVLPTLAAAREDQEMSRNLNGMLRFYMLALPPIMVAIMAGGKLLVWLILSSKFEAVAMLLLLFVPAEMFRVLGETMTVPLLARRRILPFTLLYFTQAAVFVMAAVLLVPQRGVLGAALAYMISTVSGCLFDLLGAIKIAKFRVDRHTAWLALPSVALLGGSSLACFALQSEVARIGACFVLVACWFAVNMQNDEFARLVHRGLRAVRPALR